MIVFEEAGEISKAVWDATMDRIKSAGSIEVLPHSAFYIGMDLAVGPDRYDVIEYDGSRAFTVRNVDTIEIQIEKPRNRHERRKMAKTGER